MKVKWETAKCEGRSCVSVNVAFHFDHKMADRCIFEPTSTLWSMRSILGNIDVQI